MYDTPSQVRAKTVWTVALNVLAIVATLHLLHLAREVIAWILVALFLALALEPAVAWLQKHGVKRRGLAVLVVMLAVFGMLVLLVATLVPVLIEQGRALIENAPELVDRLRNHEMFRWLDRRFQAVERGQEELAKHAGVAATSIFQMLAGVVTGIVASITVFALTVLMLLFGRRIMEGGLEWVAPPKRPHYRELARRIHKSVGGYVSGALFIALIGGVVTSVTTAALGVPYFLPLGLAMTLLGVVPYIGPTLGGVLVVGTTFLSNGNKAGIIALIVFVAYQQLEGEVLQPVIQGRTIQMNPLIIALVMLIGTAAGGIMGALVALPIAGALQVIAHDVLDQRRMAWENDAPNPTEESD